MSVVKLCVFDIDGNLINIGEWDDKGGSNPLPDGAYTEVREVVYSDDHGWRLADAPIPPTTQERLEAAEQAIIMLMMEE